MGSPVDHRSLPSLACTQGARAVCPRQERGWAASSTHLYATLSTAQGCLFKVNSALGLCWTIL